MVYVVSGTRTLLLKRMTEYKVVIWRKICVPLVSSYVGVDVVIVCTTLERAR